MNWRRWSEVGLALTRLMLGNVHLLYWTLPRWLRGGYSSPWLAKERLA